jgi:hypothetical protein
MNKKQMLQIFDKTLDAVRAERASVDSDFLKEKIDTYFLPDITELRNRVDVGQIKLSVKGGYGFYRATGEWDGYSQTFVKALADFEDALRKFARCKPEEKAFANLGLCIFLAAFILNAIFVQLHIGGIVRELSRLGVIVGIVMMIFRMFRGKGKCCS